MIKILTDKTVYYRSNDDKHMSRWFKRFSPVPTLNEVLGLSNL